MEPTQLKLEDAFKTKESLQDFCCRARQALNPYIHGTLHPSNVERISKSINDLLNECTKNGVLTRRIRSDVVSADDCSGALSIVFYTEENLHERTNHPERDV